MTWAVKFEGVSKRYRGAGWGYASLRDNLARLGRSAFTFLHRQPVEPGETLALNHVSFEVEEGEAFAIIGPNGAGKTTALKLLTRISFPTAGRIRVRGRVAALIEVGSGIHPELTGRENIWLYGRIMGMPRQQIARRFDEIVDFAELGHVLDKPVKMYSSGMQLRLGFSIASHLDPDVFVVDEALAVGDAGFQAKCVERMTHLIANGKTLLFVSHNLYAVEALCSRGIYLNRGRTIATGPTRDVLVRYLDDIDEHRMTNGTAGPDHITEGPLSLSVTCVGPDGSSRLRTGDTLTIVCDVHCARPGTQAYFHLGVSDGRPGSPLLLASQVMNGHGPVPLGEHDRVTCTIPNVPLLPRIYEVWGEVRSGQGWGSFVNWQKLTSFRVIRDLEGASTSVSHEGIDAPIRVDFWFDHTKIVGAVRDDTPSRV